MPAMHPSSFLIDGALAGLPAGLLRHHVIIRHKYEIRLPLGSNTYYKRTMARATF